ncbi:hypothetical protein [Fimbriiglobus ruber]|uniref:Secreted protein n=1 Tax=Fimbriiglobus ruber TaxID=1908690 RepID=A0A225DXB7_9BACT|nr:hypothetical protein [Fimbriiglobus ruber]OWK42336.1 hypothetical protein FRUB_04414 [Fimbriiglobus ruber]
MLARMAVLILVSVLSMPAPAADPPVRDDRPQLKLVDPPNVRLRPRAPATKEKSDRIQALIARLAEVDRPDVGYSQTFGGYAFLPVPGHVQMGSMTVTNHGLKFSQPLHDLVALGPDALPLLLEALGDKTPTKLTFQHGDPNAISRDGTTWFSDELPGNPINPRDAKLIDSPSRELKDGDHVDKYPVKIGDLCFVAIGQIVGRPYMAARYQMTACTVINSPVEDRAFRERIQKIWASDDPTRTLFESLLVDYRTTGMPEAGWNYGSNYQTGAALRLLYYFPEEFAPIIAARLNSFDVGKVEEDKESTRQGIANGGVVVDEFVHAAAWCKEPAVRAAVRGIFRRTTNVYVFVEAAEAIGTDEAKLIVEKGNQLLDGLTAGERKDGAQYHVFEVMAARAGESAAPTFRRAFEKANPVERRLLASTLRDAKGSWSIALLKPLLDDKEPTDRVYYVPDDGRFGPIPLPPPGVPPPLPPQLAGFVRGEDKTPKIPVRVCDAVAEVLAGLVPGERGQFPAEPHRTSLDRYILRLKEKIATK